MLLMFPIALLLKGISVVKRRRLSSCFAIGIALLFLNSFAARAATFNIANGDVAGLKSAINAANTNNQDDTINLAADGMYILNAVDNGTEDALPVIGADNGHTVTINGQGATIDCQTNANTVLNLRIFDLTGNAVISNLTLENAVSAERGAAIQNGSGTLTVSNCIFSRNKASHPVTSFATAGGGGLYNGAGTVNVLGCTFSENMATETDTGLNVVGGAILNNGTMTVSDCTFFANQTNGSGGAIHNANTIGVLNSTFESNELSTASSRGGGGFANTGSSATLQNCTFVNNTHGVLNGGAVYNLGRETNSATLHVTSCTFSDNVSNNGYIFCETEPSSHSSIIMQNSILQGGDPSLGVAGSGATISSQGYNLCRDGGGGFLNGPGDQINTDALLDPAGLQNNGGATLTIALTNSSPAIDKGKSFNLTTDQRGRTRPFDQPSYANATGGDGSDIGAFEGSDSLQTGMTLTVNTLNDHNDGICGGSDCSLREAIHRASNDGLGAHTITFGAGTTGTITLTGGELDFNLISVYSITLVGPGARFLAISGGSASRVFSFNSGSVTISGLTIRDGMVSGSAGNAAMGGGIYNQVSLTVNDCMFTNNQVKGGVGAGFGVSGATGQGGAIHNTGGVTLNGCTFSNNLATGGNGTIGISRQRGGNGGAGQGGAVFNDTFRSLTMTNCSFYANTAQGGNGANGNAGGNGGAGNGGAVGNSGVLVMTACTLESNAGGVSSGGTGNAGNGTDGVASGGITNITGGTATITDTISANNVANGGGGADADGAFISGGYNLLGTGDHSSGFTATGDMKGTDAAVLNAGVLGPPSNTGGPTDTLTLTSNSLAIDASSSAVAPHRDQRGYLRTGRPDIGAFENNGSLVNLVSVTRSGSDLVVGVEVVKGKVYRLERKINLTDAQWQSIFNNIDLTATGNDIEQLKDFNAIGPFSHVFYHVIFVH